MTACFNQLGMFEDNTFRGKMVKSYSYSEASITCMTSCAPSVIAYCIESGMILLFNVVMNNIVGQLADSLGMSITVESVVHTERIPSILFAARSDGQIQVWCGWRLEVVLVEMASCSAMLCCVVLYCALLCCVLCCVVLCCAVLCGVLYCVVLCCDVLYCAVLCTVLCGVALCCVLYCAVLYCAVLCCAVLCCVVLCCVVLCCVRFAWGGVEEGSSPMVLSRVGTRGSPH